MFGVNHVVNGPPYAITGVPDHVKIYHKNDMVTWQFAVVTMILMIFRHMNKLSVHTLDAVFHNRRQIAQDRGMVCDTGATKEERWGDLDSMAIGCADFRAGEPKPLLHIEAGMFLECIEVHGQSGLTPKVGVFCESLRVGL
jgi:hypothetical protein